MQNSNFPFSGVANFEEIESEKENILPLKYGRSAIQLSRELKQDISQLNSIRISYERRLMDELEEMDDPLELFLEYIQWINNAFPQGGNSKQSGMLDIMERCLMYFKDMDTYKNDPRYLKIWLWYIELFSNDSLSEARDIFVYMHRKRIGYKLALFYEEFATLLVDMTKFQEANYIFCVGINENARPHVRLMRKLEEFKSKLQDINIDINHSNNNIDMHEFLQMDEPPRMVLGKDRIALENNSIRPTMDKPNDRNKLSIFCDDEEERNDNDNKDKYMNQNGWSVLDSKHTRNKENKKSATLLESGINAGKLPQDINKPANKPLTKISIFKDSIDRTDPVYKIIEVPGKKTEKIDCNFNLIYPDNDKEYCIEELLALSRGVYYKLSKTASSTISQSQSPAKKKRKMTNILNETQINYPPTQPPIPFASSIESTDDHTVEYMTKTSILPLKDAPIHEMKPPNSPTVTFFSKDAMNDVYSMFNQYYEEPNIMDNDDTTTKFAVYENFTQEFTRPNMDDLTEIKMQPKTPNRNTENEEVRDGDNNNNAATTPSSVYKSKIKDYMTPIQEKTENSMIDAAQSSPFLTQPTKIITNPLDVKLREQLLNSILPPLNTYSTYYHYNQPLNMSHILKKIHKVSMTENKNPIVDFKKTNDLYCIRAELGEGGYATVYLAESSTGHLKALKVEKPSSNWEYYILRQIEKRLKNNPSILQSIINVESLHLFVDESYLVLNYANQGTLLDLINYYKRINNGNGIDETLCMFITIELIKVITTLHSVGIIHGDLKPDNCMIRFSDSKLTSSYDSNGANGWNKKGIYLIDFGRSFDMTLVPKGTKFIANWVTDEQDCLLMRQGKPWSYESDYYGLANMIHCMLYGKIINGGQAINGMKRYWKQEIWVPLFNLLLKEEDASIVEMKLVEIRGQLENELLGNNTNSNKLKSVIYDLENELYTMNLKI